MSLRGNTSRLSSQLIQLRPFLSPLGGLALNHKLPIYGTRTVSNPSKERPDMVTPVTQAKKHMPLPETSQNIPRPIERISEADIVSPNKTNSLKPLLDVPNRERSLSEWEKAKELEEVEKQKNLEAWQLEMSWVNPDSPWGFLVYRAVYGKESDESFQQMLGLLRETVTKPRSYLTSSLYRPLKVDPGYELTVMEDEKRFAGADTHTIRDAFREWVADDLPPRVRHPEFAGGVDTIRTLVQNGWDDSSDEYVPDEPIHPSLLAPPRWGFCLLVDDFCLRSLNRTKDHPDRPMVKLVNLLYSGGRCENIAEGWADGETDDPQEDVGWMYMYASDFGSCYATLHSPAEWDNEAYYCRPSKDDYPLANQL